MCPSQDWEQRLQAGLGRAPAPDFAAWCQHHSEATAALQPVTLLAKPWIRRDKLAAAVRWSVLGIAIVVGAVWLSLPDGWSPVAFAEPIPAIDGVATLTWTTTYYGRVTSADGKRTWIRTERRQHAYRHPGQYRETLLDDAGQSRAVRITDVNAGRILELDLQGKTAVLKHPSDRLPDDRGPFAWVGDALRKRQIGEALRVKSISLQGERELDQQPVNVVRAMIELGPDQGYGRHDFLFDVNTKRLAGVWIPEDQDFDPQTAADRDQPAEKRWSTEFPVGRLEHEIVLNPSLSPEDFRLDPPANYAFQKLSKPTVTEEEMIAFLGAAARLNNGVFPDSPTVALAVENEDSSPTRVAKPSADAEQELNELLNRFRMREIYRSPVEQFELDHTVADSFQYVGSEVRLGHGDQLVCWYRLRRSSEYRAVYGDLSVKKVTAEQLPLTLQP